MPLTHVSMQLGPLDNNTFLLVDEATRACAAIDVGFDPEVVLDRIARDRLDLKLLLLTHAHYDHACGMRRLQRDRALPCLLHPEDRPLLEFLSQQGAMFGLPPADPPANLVDIADGQKLSLGESQIEVIHTPGHSPGGVCFRYGDDLWVGDTLFAGSIGRTDLPGGSWEILENSIRTRLFTLGDSVRCYPGHGPETTIGIERQTNPFVGERAGNG
jgi:glyoxylase-like metal-dependent hydrolase (beta-lactamase superfamily II)